MQHMPANTSTWITTIAVGWLMVRAGTAKNMLKIRQPDRCAACGRLGRDRCPCMRRP